jgi:hypothetical protein
VQKGSERLHLLASAAACHAVDRRWIESFRVVNARKLSTARPAALHVRRDTRDRADVFHKKLIKVRVSASGECVVKVIAMVQRARPLVFTAQ